LKVKDIRAVTLLRKFLPQSVLTIIFRIYEKLFDPYVTKSYSQEGEDMILKRIFSDKSNGFYVDVGAHHPRRFSNTYIFYKLGWRGINIDPNPDAIHAFELDRKHDINLQCGVSEKSESLTYYFFDDPALNSYDVGLVEDRLANTPYKIVGQRNIKVERLDSILNKHLPKDVEIDFLSIDAEGLDFEVLKSNNWDLFRPACVLVESLDSSLEKVIQGEIFLFMKARGYGLFARTYNTLVFRVQEDPMFDEKKS
jgi:FkbM family methyltransferase